MGNSRNFGLWIVAPDRDTALEVAFRVGHIKKPFSRRVTVCDITDAAMDSELERQRGVSNLIGSSETGVASIVGRCLTMDEIYSGVKSSSRWVFRSVAL